MMELRRITNSLSEPFFQGGGHILLPITYNLLNGLIIESSIFSFYKDIHAEYLSYFTQKGFPGNDQR